MRLMTFGFSRHCWLFIYFSCLMISDAFLQTHNTLARENNSSHFDSLQKRLIDDGFNKDMITMLYNNPLVYFDAKGVSLFFKHKESTLNYDQFTTKESIQKARNYIKKYKKEFSRAQKDYGVNKEVITAIILVETRLGTVTGKKSVLNILSTMASLLDPNVKKMLWGKISGSSELTFNDYEKWVQKRAKWSYKELKAFLKYTSREKLDPSSIYGSCAGAIGIAQFMPSNILFIAKDGNSDGSINLFDHADAISSIASYLKHYGWHPHINEKKAYEVIYHYNHSAYYVNIILKIADILKG